MTLAIAGLALTAFAVHCEGRSIAGPSEMRNQNHS
jgi:hypothetical protein